MESKKLQDQWWFRFTVIAILAIGLVWLFAKVANYAAAPAPSSNPTTQQFTAKQVVDPRLTAIASTTPTWGNANAKITIVEFGDFQCPYCEQEFPIIRQVMQQYKDQIFFIWRQFPIVSVHPQAPEAAEASVCAQVQGKFWPFHDQLYSNQADLSSNALLNDAVAAGLDKTSFIKCMADHKQRSVVLADLQTGLDNGVPGTPTFFINGTMINGAVDKTFWDKAIALLGK